MCMYMYMCVLCFLTYYYVLASIGNYYKSLLNCLVILYWSTCTDINECSTNNGGCQHHCTNTDGSYVCSCNEGYKLTNDGYTCEGIYNQRAFHVCLTTQIFPIFLDINECSSGNGGCGQSCVNQLGSYKCGCGPGYLLSSDAHNCNGTWCLHV